MRMTELLPHSYWHVRRQSTTWDTKKLLLKNSPDRAGGKPAQWKYWQFLAHKIFACCELFQVGLRWWNYINQAGESEWVFESRDGTSTLDSLASNFGGKADARLFWIGLVFAPLMWIIFFLTALFGFKWQWLILVIIGLSMSMSNLLGYLRCRLGSTQTVSSMANTYMQRQMFSNLLNMFKGKPETTTPNDVI